MKITLKYESIQSKIYRQIIHGKESNVAYDKTACMICKVMEQKKKTAKHLHILCNYSEESEIEKLIQILSKKKNLTRTKEKK